MRTQFLVILCILVHSFAHGGDVYEAEIAMIQESHQALITKGNEVLKQAEQFRRIWDQVANHFEILNLTINSASVTPVKSSPDRKTAYYRAMVREQIFINELNSRLPEIVRVIKEKTKQSLSLTAQAPFLQPWHQKVSARTMAKMEELQRQLASRKQKSDDRFKEWNDRKLSEWIDAENLDRQQFITDVKTDLFISRLPNTFYKLHQRVRMALMQGNLTLAKNNLSAASWFRSTIPVYLSGKTLSDGSLARLTEALKNSEIAEQKLRVEVNKLVPRPKKHGSVFRLANRSPAQSTGSDAGENENDSDGDDFLEDPGPGVDIPGGVDFDRDPDRPFTAREKVVNEMRAAAMDQGLEKNEKGQITDTVQVDTPTEVQQNIDKHLQGNFNPNTAGQANSSSKEGPLSHSQKDVSDFIDRVKSDIPGPLHNSFGRLEGAVKAWKENVKRFEEKVEKSEARVADASNTIDKEIGHLILPDFGATSFPALTEVFPAHSSNFTAFSWQALRDLAVLPDQAPLGGYSQFLDSGFSLGGPGKYLERGIIQDVIEDMNGVPPDQRRMGKVSVDRLGALEAFLKERARLGYQPISFLDSVGIAHELAAAFQEAAGITPLGFSDRVRNDIETAMELGLKYSSLGELVSLYEFVSGRSFIKGKEIPPEQRVLGALQLALKPFKDFADIQKEISALREGMAGEEKNAQRALRKAEEIAHTQGVKSAKRHDALIPGRLHRMDPKAVKSFRDGTYWAKVHDKPRTLYHSGSKPYVGQTLPHFWTDTKPTTRSQNGSNTHWIEVEIPAGIELFEGIGDPTKGYFIGVQIYVIPDPKWIKSTGLLK